MIYMANGLLGQGCKTFVEEISSKNCLMKIRLGNISQTNNSFYKFPHNQDVKQNENAKTQEDFIFQNSKKNNVSLL